MMGYMGFGMQSWIYRMNPRKPFSTKRRSSFISLPKYSRSFQLKPSIKENDKLRGIITVLSIAVFSILLGLLYFEFMDYSNQQNELMFEKTITEDKKAFDFLLKSGKKRLMRNDILGAYSELKLAYNINSKEIELNTLLIEILSILCDKNEIYCGELDKILIDSNKQ